MSDYPPHPYGAGYGARDHGNPPYLPPTYPNQYLQTEDGRTVQGQVHAASNYDAYGYNRAIPAFSAAAVASGVPPLPIYQGWNQDSIPLPPYTAPSNPTQYAGYTDSSQHNTQYYPVVSQTGYQPPVTAPRPFEQGELSEGEFEDGAVATNTPPAGYGTTRYHGNDGTGYIDNAQRAVYSRTQDYSPHQSSYPANNLNYSPQDISQSRRQQSDSYSPYISPKEDNDDQSKANQYQDPYAPSHTAEPINGVSQPQYGWPQNGLGNNSQPNTSTNGNHNSNIVENISQVLPVQAALSEISSATNGRSVAEGKRKAQGAILNLWPYDVRYQTYIDEGFKEDIVGRLFDDLRMPRTLAKSTNGAQTMEQIQHHRITPRNFNLQENIAPITSNGNSSNLKAGRHQIVADYSNDISPLGASAKQPLINGSTTTQNTTMAGSTATETPTSLNDKERTIQAKMEALRKSREERAQKAAAQKSAKSSTALAPVTQSEEPKPVEASKESNSSSPSPSSISQPQIPPRLAPSDSPAQSINIQQQPPAIPGLFLTSTTSSPAPSTNAYSTMYPPPHTTSRKRPVAADFDEPLTSMTTVKRPFGQSRTDQPLVIDVSDDDAESNDEDVAMDLESEANQDSPVQSARSLFDNQSATIQNLPPLSNFPTRKPTSPGSSAANTPPIPQVASRSSLGRPEVLQQKESEIELLKKKIAEAEARKKARQTPSGTRTPRSIESNGVEGNNSSVVNANTTSNVEASIAMQRLIGIADNQVNAEQQRLAEAQAAESEKAEELKRHEAERIRLRREEIETELPLVESEYQRNQRRLEEMRAEMARIEATVQRNLEQKQKFTEEMARLGQETENQLQAQKKKLRDLTKDEVESNTAPSLPPASILAGGDTDKHSERIANGQIPMRSVSAQSSPSSTKSVNGQVQTSHSSLTTASVEQMVLPTATNGLSNNCDVNGPQLTGPTAMNDSTKDRNSADHALEAALQEAVRAEADSHTHEDADVDMEISYAPDPNQPAPDSPVVEEKGSPEYTPLPRRTSYVIERESDDYEPPEATPPIGSPPFSPAPPNEDALVTVDDSIPGIVLGSAIQSVSDNNSNQAIDVDGNRDVLPLQNSNTPQLSEVLKETSSGRFFTPYESPLRRFRAYRFHPEFNQQIPGGLRSLTYSHKIDPMVEFCRYELAGGICNDTTCDLLHFKDIGLPDDVILTALGSPEEFKGTRRDEFCDGLKEVLMDLRVRKIRDFQVIAAEILAYRTKFLGDSSKVLPLEGTSI